MATVAKWGVDQNHPALEGYTWAVNPTLRRLLLYFRPHVGAFGLAIGLMAISAAIPGALVFLVERVLNEVLLTHNQTMLARLPFLVVGLYLLKGVVAVSRGLVTRNIAWSVVTTLRRQVFAHLLILEPAWHQKQATGALVSRLSSDVASIQYGVSGIVTAIERPLTLIVLLVAAFVMEPRLTLYAMLVLPFVAFAVDRFGARLRSTAQDSLDNMAGLVSSSAETLSGIRTVQAHQGEAQRLKVFDHDNQEQKRLQMRAFAAQLIPGPVVEAIAAVGVGAVLWIGGQRVLEGQTQPGALVAFLVALGLLNEPLKGLAKIQSLTQRALAGANAVFSILDRAPAIVDEGQERVEGHVSLALDGVGFDYGQGPVLHDVTLHIPAGQVVALVGPSGAGKSTLASLIPRFADPTHGVIRLNDRPLASYRLSSLRQSVAVVSQETFLFNDTVANNIAFGVDASPEDIHKAAEAANAAAFIQALPQGYDTPIDELGMRLSGGQRQRLCIARAILRNAPILILDEATSALDTESEALVQEALQRLMENRTTLVIAHRLSTVKNADRIVVIEDGRITEEGDHQGLLDRDGAYAGLVARQA